MKRKTEFKRQKNWQYYTSKTCSSIEIFAIHKNIKLNILSVRLEAHGTLKEGDKPAAERDASISGVMKAFAPSVPAAALAQRKLFTAAFKIKTSFKFDIFEPFR
ncbi:unnamed protein product [Brugia timori]|uniref:TonB_C domain-containing protein n=1 Tax=Brugia timori TaxID=42155 RepID=A0A0R3R3W4_9BILA|nr:unnamed protein product [Brugia timori]